jgi:hypothetical protein
MNEHHSKREDKEYVRKGNWLNITEIELRKPLKTSVFRGFLTPRRKSLCRNSLYYNELAIFSKEFLEAQPGFPEIPFSAMTSQCLDRRIDTLEKLSTELEAWQSKRNEKRKLVEWQFTKEDARIKPHKVYPSL